MIFEILNFEKTLASIPINLKKPRYKIREFDALREFHLMGTSNL